MAGERRYLYLVRHAFAAHADPARWPDDALRPLTEEGADRFREAARGLQWLVPEVDAMLSSGYARAWQTAELLHEGAGWPEPEECWVLEAGQPPAAAVDVLHGRTERSIALVGHEPHLSGLASLLSTGSEDRLEAELKKGGAAALSFAGRVEPAAAELRWIVSPKILRRLGR